MTRLFDNHDLIAAIATPKGNGGVGIVRLSGPDQDIQKIAEKIIKKVPKTRYAQYTSFFSESGDVVDEGIAIYFPAPHSFTGESVLELQAHGGAVVLDCLLAAVLQQGARMANAGEFSMRAYMNGKMDLLQAESICDLITAGTEAAARSATRSLQGEFSKHVNGLLEKLIELRRYVEAAIDFSEEEIDFLQEGQVAEQVDSLQKSVNELLKKAQQGVLLQQGASLAIVGEPNVGKSSLLNRLTATDTAIVTNVAGTTRDVLRERIQIDGLPIHLVDTAGLRETQDQVEKVGIERSWQEVSRADCLLFVWDLSTTTDPSGSEILQKIQEKVGKQVPVVLVGNKLDQAVDNSVGNLGSACDQIWLSAKTGAGVDKLRERIKELMGYHSETEAPFTARRRHISALERVLAALQAGKQQVDNGLGDCLAEELRYAQEALAELTGEFSSDDLLGEIFANFCVGK